MTNITNDEFIALFNSPNNPPLNDYIIEGNVEFNSSNYPHKPIYITNCHFRNQVLFESVTLDPNIFFGNGCGFEQSLLFKNCNSTSDSETSAGDSANLIVNSCTIGSLALLGNNFRNGVKFYSVELDSFAVNGLTSEKDLFLEKSTIKNICIIRHIKLSQIKFFNCQLLNITKIQNTSVEVGYFFDCKFIGMINISEGKFSETLCFQNNKAEDYMFIDNIDSEGALRIFNGNEFKKAIQIDYYNKKTKISRGFNKIDLESSQFLGSMEIIGPDNISISSKINQLIISGFLKGRINFTNFIIKEAEITRSNADTQILFNHVKFSKLIFNYFTKSGELQFLNMESTGENDTSLEIIYSYLGKAQFLNASLDSFSTIRIEHSILSEIITSNVKWFSPEKLNQPLKNKNLDHLKNIRELFGQLKYAIEKQGNTIQALDFKRHEMSAYKNELDLKWKKNIKDWFVMFVNQSNDYGRDWTLPVVLAATVTFMFYCFLIIIVEPVSTDWAFYDYGYVFFNLLNPLHTLDKLFPDTNIPNSFLVNALDFIYKIVISYLIFQTVSAFRKHIK